MTVLIAVKRNDGSVVMAADKRVSMGNGWRIPMKDSKIGRVGPMLVGVCGDSAPGEILLHMKAPKRTPATRDALVCLRRSIMPKLLREVSALFDDVGDWGALIALDGRIFELDGGGGVTEVEGPWWAMGSGKTIAMGFLRGYWQGSGKAPTILSLGELDQVLQSAVRCAADYNAYCGDGYDFAVSEC